MQNISKLNLSKLLGLCLLISGAQAPFVNMDSPIRDSNGHDLGPLRDLSPHFRTQEVDGARVLAEFQTGIPLEIEPGQSVDLCFDLARNKGTGLNNLVMIELYSHQEFGFILNYSTSKSRVVELSSKDNKQNLFNRIETNCTQIIEDFLSNPQNNLHLDLSSPEAIKKSMLRIFRPVKYNPYQYPELLKYTPFDFMWQLAQVPFSSNLHTILSKFMRFSESGDGQGSEGWARYHADRPSPYQVSSDLGLGDTYHGSTELCGYYLGRPYFYWGHAFISFALLLNTIQAHENTQDPNLNWLKAPHAEPYDHLSPFAIPFRKLSSNGHSGTSFMMRHPSDESIDSNPEAMQYYTKYVIGSLTEFALSFLHRSEVDPKIFQIFWSNLVAATPLLGCTPEELTQAFPLVQLADPISMTSSASSSSAA